MYILLAHIAKIAKNFECVLEIRDQEHGNDSGDDRRDDDGDFGRYGIAA